MINPEQELNHVPTKEWHRVIQMYAKKSNYKRALDIGTASGLSGWSIAMNGTGKIVSVDVKSQRKARNLAKHCGYIDRITFFGEGSEKFFVQNSDMFDLIIVDGCHRLPEVKKDAVSGWKVLNSGGYMVFDDYNHPRLKSDIQPAVAQFMAETGARIEQVTNKAVTRKP